MTPEQCRAARGWLGWSQMTLAERAGVGLSTVKGFERGGRTIAATANAMRRAIETAGIRLLEDEAGMAAGIARADAGAGCLSEIRPLRSL
jgi:ribosome-binding protein aMBF1 (putative translation factor)